MKGQYVAVGAAGL